MSQYKVVFVTMLIFAVLLYTYQYHSDSLLNLYASTPAPIYSPRPATVSHSEENVIREEDNHGEINKTSTPSSSSSLLHTNQLEYNKRRAQQCGIVSEVPKSSYGMSIQNIAVSYFNKKVDNFKFTLCTVPKVGSTNWKRTLIVLAMPAEERAKQTKETVNAMKNVHNSRNIEDLSRSRGSPDRPPYSNYFNTVFFRHPFTRVVSAWRNKFQLVDGKVNPSFYKKYGRAMIELSRGKGAVAEFEQNKKDHLVTFPEFIEGMKAGLIDRHWMPQTEICYPCKVDYDFVGFFEYMDSDTNYVLSKIGVVSDSLHADKLSTAGRTYSTVDLTKELFKQLPVEDINFLITFYQKDFFLFGYGTDVNDEHFPFPAINQTS